MTKLIIDLKVNMNNTTKVYFMNDMDQAKDSGFDITTLEGIKEFYSDAEVLHNIKKYSINLAEAMQVLKNINNLLNEYKTVSTKVLNKNQILKVLFSLKDKKVIKLLQVLSADQNEEKLTFIQQQNFEDKSSLIEWVYHDTFDLTL